MAKKQNGVRYSSYSFVVWIAHDHGHNSDIIKGIEQSSKYFAKKFE